MHLESKSPARFDLIHTIKRVADMTATRDDFDRWLFDMDDSLEELFDALRQMLLKDGLHDRFA